MREIDAGQAAFYKLISGVRILMGDPDILERTCRNWVVGAGATSATSMAIDGELDLAFQIV